MTVLSATVIPQGTQNDRSTTTYLEEEGDFSTTIGRVDRISAIIPQTASSASLLQGTPEYDLLESAENNWIQTHCTYEGSSSNICVESRGYDSLHVQSFTTTTQTNNVASTPYLELFLTFTASTPTTSSTATPVAASATSTVIPNSGSRKHIDRNIIGRAVGGAIGGAILLAILTLLIYITLRRQRHCQRPSRQPFVHSVPATTRTLSSDTKDINSQMGPFATMYIPAPPYHRSSVRSWSAESRSVTDTTVFVATPSTSTSFHPPSPRTKAHEGPSTPERLPSDLGNRPSKFVEQLMVNSTNLDVLVAIAKAEAKQKRRQSNHAGGSNNASNMGRSEESEQLRMKPLDESEQSNLLHQSFTGTHLPP